MRLHAAVMVCTGDRTLFGSMASAIAGEAVETSFTKGAVSMSKKQTIVKNLNSIQNFGAIDILCTDKNGTQTQDKVVLVTSLKKAYVRHYGELL